MELMEDGRCWERLMEVEADICFLYLVLTDVEWKQDELVTMNPNGIGLKLLA